ncbi:glycoside hydrolase domain-containing protein [Fundicoccus sp. Sow4_H7]|uniref:DUF4091 domain-containing protein n=1 Tax=Fundicoccus sp. Sow4_H7 TaxID=3438784 RepID=UPI003F8F1ADF
MTATNSIQLIPVSTNQAITQTDYSDLLQQKPQAIHETVWQNDQLMVQFAILSQTKTVENIHVQLKTITFNPQINNAAHHEETLGTHEIPLEVVENWFKIFMVQEVDAHTGFLGYGSTTRPLPIGDRQKAAEVLVEQHMIESMPAQHLQAVWIQSHIPAEAPVGHYKATIAVTFGENSAEEVTGDIYFEVLEAVLADAKTFDIELWQNPYAVAEYYGVEPFSKAHFDLLEPHMLKYREIGGNAITATIVEEAWAGQTYSKHETKFPSMVKWTKTAAGDFHFDYEDFDSWVRFNKAIGLGDKIVCYTLAPWTNQVVYFDEASQQMASFATDADEASDNWTVFLKDFMAHTQAQGWSRDICIGIDERGFDEAIFEVLEAVKGEDGQPFKVAGAMDSIVAKRHFNPHITDLSVGTIPVKESADEFASIMEERDALGLKTSIYSCTGHSPGNFSLNAPAESYWTIAFAYANGAQGFLRWAYDSWVEDPLRDTTHNAFEAGDTFLVFPSEKDAPDPQPQSSLRLEKLAQGVHDVNKLIQLAQVNPAIDIQVQDLLKTVKQDYESEGYYLTADSKAQIIADMDLFRRDLHDLTRFALKEGFKLTPARDDADWVETELTIPTYHLADDFVTTIERPTEPEHMYLGQPDMIAMPDDENHLLIAYPKGHGAGPIILQKSLDGGESWEKQSTPRSWEESYETPTLYNLEFTDGRVKQVLISGRPNWKNNPVGGWQMSVSEDKGATWTEFENYHARLDGEDHWTTVPMASLVQLYDENGQPMDKWMGVYHNNDFINYKSYLTFDEATAEPHWSQPEAYLAEHRQLETLYQICEVGLFYSPDKKTLSALGRSQSHEHSSVVFHSYDQGQTWSQPQELPLELWGERHKVQYDPESGRLLVTFRQMIQLKHVNPAITERDWLAGDWMLWVGTYQDILSLTEGEYRIRLIQDWTPSRRGGDTGYAGFVTQSDGTLILASYGHWDKHVSQNNPNDPLGDLSYIKQVKFKLSDIEKNEKGD